MCRYRPFILRMLPSAVALQGVRRRLRNTTGRTGPSTACGLPRDAAVCSSLLLCRLFLPSLNASGSRLPLCRGHGDWHGSAER